MDGMRDMVVDKTMTDGMRQLVMDLGVECDDSDCVEVEREWWDLWLIDWLIVIVFVFWSWCSLVFLVLIELYRRKDVLSLSMWVWQTILLHVQEGCRQKSFAIGIYDEKERKETLDVEIKNMIWLFRMVGLDEWGGGCTWLYSSTASSPGRIIWDVMMHVSRQTDEVYIYLLSWYLVE